MNYYNEIKKELLDNEINKKVKDYNKNKYEIEKYYNVGKLLVEAGNNYGEGIIKEYSMDKTFLVIYRLKYDKRKYLEEIYNNQCNKLFGPKWKEAKETLREYIDNEL